MTYYHPLAVVFCVLVLLAVSNSRVFRFADAPPTAHPGGRISNIDGLRGFLAYGVFFHHAAMGIQSLHDHVDGLPPSRFLVLIGQAGVAMFFLITSYLFWSKLIAARGRPSWHRLYIGRVFRIGPLYLLLALIAMLIAGFATRWTMGIEPFTLLKQCIKLLMLGIVFPPIYSLNNYWIGSIVGPIWTLAYEWKFYAALLLMSWFARRNGSALWFSASLVTLFSFYASMRASGTTLDAWIFSCLLFSLGMLCAVLQRWQWLSGISDNVKSFAFTAILAILYMTSSSCYEIVPIFLLAAAFFLILSGASIFGLLHRRSARRMGDLSYSIYLLQGVVSGAIYSSPTVTAFAVETPLHYWLVTLVTALSLLLLSLLTYVTVERPGIALGRSVINRIDAIIAGSRRRRVGLFRVRRSKT